MRIVLTGGGSGGHITPVLAVANELKRLKPEVQITFFGQKGDKLADIPKIHPAIDDAYAVQAGKFRRYQGEGWRQVFDLPTQAKNIRDAFRVAIGIWQSYWLLRRLKPDVIFTRGGFVSVPVAIGGKLNGIPYITHDSDSTPSLANRVIARWAKIHAVALPAELYPYPSAKTVMVGVPVDAAFIPVTQKIQQNYRRELKLHEFQKVLLVTGGGNGAQQLNRVIINNAAALLRHFPDLVIIHIVGRSHTVSADEAYDKAILGQDRRRVRVEGFVNGLARYSGAADVIVARAGASGLAEFAVQSKACIIIPAKQLAWQSHHANVLAEQGAIVNMTEEQSENEGYLGEVIADLLHNGEKRQRLARSLARFARPDAARHLAMILLEQIPSSDK